MFKIPKIKLRRMEKTIIVSPRFLAENYFSTFLVTSFLSVVLAMFIFYQYGINIKNDNLDITGEALRFDESAYQNVISEWERKQEEFSKTDTQQYKNPFGFITSQ